MAESVLQRVADDHRRACERLTEVSREEYFSAIADNLVMSLVPAGEWSKAKLEILQALRTVYRDGKAGRLG